jgi:predicted TIM-barrel fold metal-dependent hydrolase
VEIIDFHLHLPLKNAGGDEKKALEILIREMDESSVAMAVAIAIEASPVVIRDHVSPELLRRAVEPLLYDWKALAHPSLYAAMTSPRKALEDHLKLVERHLAPSESVVRAAALSGGRVLAVASYCRLNSIDEFIDRLEKLRSRGPLIGVKIYPTFHFIRPDDPALEPLYDYMESKNLILIVHTGCDPGIWELPVLCSKASPRYVEGVAKAHRDLPVVVAHMGSYSYLFPGIYFADALKVAKKYDNVYLDTSATTLHQVKIAINRIGADKLLYGSDYPYFEGLSMKDIVEAYLDFRIPERVKERILFLNAYELLSGIGVKLTLPPRGEGRG